jgi:hypothetical protein
VRSLGGTIIPGSGMRDPGSGVREPGPGVRDPRSGIRCSESEARCAAFKSRVDDAGPDADRGLDDSEWDEPGDWRAINEVAADVS